MNPSGEYFALQSSGKHNIMTLFIQFVSMHSDSVPKFSMKVGQFQSILTSTLLVSALGTHELHCQSRLSVCAQLMLSPPCRPGLHGGIWQQIQWERSNKRWHRLIAWKMYHVGEKNY